MALEWIGVSHDDHESRGIISVVRHGECQADGMITIGAHIQTSRPLPPASPSLTWRLIGMHDPRLRIEQRVNLLE